MLDEMVQDWVTDLLAEKEEWSQELSLDFDFAALEAKVGEASRCWRSFTKDSSESSSSGSSSERSGA